MTEDEQKKIFAHNLTNYVNASGKMQKEIAKELNFNEKTFSGWCNGLSIPTMGKVQSIADYFGVGKSDLLDPHEEDESYYLNKDTKELAEFLYRNPNYKVLFDASKKVKPEDIEFVKQMIERMGGLDG